MSGTLRAAAADIAYLIASEGKKGRELDLLKAILFDLDGTLLNRAASLEHFIEAQHTRLRSCLGHIPPDVFKARFVELDSRGYVWKDKVYNQLIKDFHITRITSKELLDDYVAHFRSSCVPFPNLAEMLEHFNRQNLLMGIITNGFTAFQSGNLQALDIEKYFASILISEQEGVRKPNPLIFARALTQLGVQPEESLYVGDHPVNDVQAAQHAGMIGVWKRDDYWGVPEGADFVIDDLLELVQVARRLQNRSV